MQHLEFDVFTNGASGQALGVGDPQPHLHQVNLDPSDLRQHWLRTDNDANAGLLHAGIAPGLILSRTFSYAIDVVGAAFGNGQFLQQHPVNANSNQLWNVRHLSADPNSQARIIECTDPNSGLTYAIDAPYGNPNTDPHIWRTHEHSNQQWTPVPELIAVNAFKIQSLASGKVLDVPNGAQNAGVTIQQFHDAGQVCFNQFWQLLDAAGESIDDPQQINSGDLVRIRSVCNGLFLQPQASGGTSVIIQAAENGENDQLWRMVGNNAAFEIQPAADQTLALDLPDGSDLDHVPIQVFRDNGGAANQRWTFA